MKKLFIFFFLIFLNYHGFSAVLLDSVGVKRVNSQEFIIHEVEAGETLYALSRRYNVAVQEINAINEGSISSLSIGQQLLIPLNAKPVPKGATLHIVKSSETLFSISRLYNVPVDDLKKWNNLIENSISIGQELLINNVSSAEKLDEPENKMAGNRKIHTVEPSQTLYSISKMYGVSTNNLIEWNQLESNALDVGQVLFVSFDPSPENGEETSNSSMLPVENQETAQPEVKNDIVEATPDLAPVVVSGAIISAEEQDDEVAPPVAKIVEKGICEVIENAPDTKKYLAFHRNAPVGTIMQVRNEMNNQSVFVRVVNTIPQTGDNSKVILQISKKAFDRLGAVDKRFPVEISYIP